MKNQTKLWVLLALLGILYFLVPGDLIISIEISEPDKVVQEQVQDQYDIDDCIRYDFHHVSWGEHPSGLSGDWGLIAECPCDSTQQVGLLSETLMQWGGVRIEGVLYYDPMVHIQEDSVCQVWIRKLSDPDPPSETLI